MKASVIRKSHFNAAHRLHNRKWSEEKNQQVFGLCNNANYDMKLLANLIKMEIEERFDHKNLNLDVPDFIDLIPSAENICAVIYYILRQKIESEFDLSIKLWETPRNCVEYPAKI